MTRFTSPHGLRPISLLFSEKENKINSLINNLKIRDVKEDATFQSTSDKVKGEILLQPIAIDEPHFVDHEYEEKSLTIEQQFMGGIRHHYIHTIAFPFSGNIELLSYAPEHGFSFSSSDRGLVIPYGNKIETQIDLPELNPQNAIIHAKKELNMTLRFAEANNNSVNAWNDRIAKRIDELLQIKREELIRIFGS